MNIKASFNGNIVIIIDIKVGNIKDCKEVLVIYYDWETGALGFEKGDEEILGHFTIEE